jgi:hypothetical protein
MTAVTIPYMQYGAECNAIMNSGRTRLRWGGGGYRGSARETTPHAAGNVVVYQLPVANSL